MAKLADFSGKMAEEKKLKAELDIAKEERKQIKRELHGYGDESASAQDKYYLAKKFMSVKDLSCTKLLRCSKILPQMIYEVTLY